MGVFAGVVVVMGQACQQPVPLITLSVEAMLHTMNQFMLYQK